MSILKHQLELGLPAGWCLGSERRLAPEDTKWVRLLWVRAEFSSNQLGRVPRRVEDLGEFTLEYRVPGSG